MCVIVQCLCMCACMYLVDHCANKLNEMAAVRRLSCESGCTGELRSGEKKKSGSKVMNKL